MTSVDDLIADFVVEQTYLESVLERLPEGTWRTPTNAARWDVRDCIGHLTYFNQTALMAVTEPDGFRAHAELKRSGGLPEPDLALARATSGPYLLEMWTTSRLLLADALATTSARRVPWYGPDMSVASFTTARLMETWAHGVDVTDALAVPLSVTARLRHVCHIGLSTRAYVHDLHGMRDDGAPVRVEVTGPGGEHWTWGPEDAGDRVEGSAADLALLVTRRRNRADLALVVTGSAADRWMSIAQSYVGMPGPVRPTGLPSAPQPKDPT